MADIKKLNNVENFARKTLEHIFDGTINSKGNATGYHYSKVTDSKGKIISGTRSSKDRKGQGKRSQKERVQLVLSGGMDSSAGRRRNQ